MPDKLVLILFNILYLQQMSKYLCRVPAEARLPFHVTSRQQNKIISDVQKFQRD
jgi:hypothetical protein